jgi:hypothetical protein
MRAILHAVLVAAALAPLQGLAAEEKFSVELNSIEAAENRCKVNFVAENKAAVQLDSMKLDLVFFGTDGAIIRRYIFDIGPVRAMKTVVRNFLVDAECRQLGGILVNDVTACAPGEPGACLDSLVLSSRLQGVRLYK